MNYLSTQPFWKFLAYRLLFIVLLSSIGVRPALAQVTRYVSTTGTNTNPASALSWATSTTNLQGAIDASVPGDQVWVRTGLYKPGGNGHSNRDLSFSMKNGVGIYGGFAGSETTLAQRVAITISTPSGTTLSGDVGILNNPTDNSFHLFNNPSGLNTTALLNGFVIIGGNTSGSSPETYGGGMYNKANGAGQVCSPQVVSCVFENNTGSEGGAMYNNANGGGTSSPTLIECIFRNNSASSFGGAILNDGGSTGTSSPVLIKCLFQNNTAPTGLGGAFFNYGSAGNSSPIFTNCSFLSNEASQGGAIYNEGSGGNSNPQLTNCAFQSNSATTAGAIYSNGSFDMISNALLIRKRMQDGSANKVDKGTSNPQLTNCVLFANGGSNTFVNTATSGIVARYCLFEPSVTNYTSVTGNITTTTSPFVSTTSTQIAICSPAVNAGDPATTTATVGVTDLAGAPRFFSGTGTPAARIDIGAYEVQTFPTVAITSQPAASSVACVGSTVRVVVSVSGTATGFQWYRTTTGGSTTMIAGATSATLTLANVQTTSAGSYSVAITGNCNSTTSTAFTLIVNPLPARLYVRASVTANANQTGLSWADAFPDLQLALQYTCRTNLTEIWVANGLYKPTSTTARTISFAMLPNVGIYGGFVGTESTLNERIVTLPSGTTLSGEIGDPNSTTDNSYHVISNPAGLTTTAVLDGFVITAGNANGSSPNNAGGGLYNSADSPTIQNCFFQGNLATTGGAIVNYGNGPVITNCYFQSNSAIRGGVMSNISSSPILTNCTFLSNSATDQGGTLFNQNSNAIANNCLFQSNVSPIGGALYNFTSSLVLTNCSFLSNTAVATGGALHNQSQSNVTLTNCSFQGNSSAQGGALYNNNSNPVLANSVVFNNGGNKTFVNSTTGVSVSVTYSLLDASVMGYTSGPTNLTTTISPFASNTSNQLASNSPAINAGNPATSTATVGQTDLAGNPRFVNTVIDMGAYEFQGILEVFTLKDGLWDDPTVWSPGRLPLGSERVRLKHAVTMPTGFLGVCETLIYDPDSKLIYDTGGRLRLGQ